MTAQLSPQTLPDATVRSARARTRVGVVYSLGSRLWGVYGVLESDSWAWLVAEDGERIELGFWQYSQYPEVAHVELTREYVQRRDTGGELPSVDRLWECDPEALRRALTACEEVA